MLELRCGIENSMLLLRAGGRTIVFTKTLWEEKLVQEVSDSHPYALLSYVEPVDPAVETSPFNVNTKMWVLVRRAAAAYVVKNATLSDKDVKESGVRWTTGAVGGQTRGFPAENFAFTDLDSKERRAIAAQRRAAPPRDHDDADDEWKRSRGS
jgi:hypothetical protein